VGEADDFGVYLDVCDDARGETDWIGYDALGIWEQ